MAEKPNTLKTSSKTAGTKNVAQLNVAGAGRASNAAPMLMEPPLPLHHVGHALKEGREARGLSIEDVANELMIRRIYLQAIEDGHYKTLPDRVYALGFVRNFANYLGLDANTLTEQFRREAYSGRPQNNKSELAFPEPVTHNIVPGKAALAAGAVLAVLALAVGLYMAGGDDNVAKPTVAPSPTIAAPANVGEATNSTGDITTQAAPATGATTETTETTTPTAAPKTAEVVETAPAQIDADVAVSNLPKAAAPTTTPQEEPTTQAAAPVATTVALVVKQPSWIEVRNAGGQTLLSKIAKAGEVVTLPNQTGLTLTVGNAGGVLLQVGNKTMATFGPVGEVRRNIKLDSLLPKAAPAETNKAVAPAMPAPTSLPSTTQE